MTTLFKRTVLPALALAAGLAHAQVPWHLPSTVHFPGYCDVLTNLTYTGPAQWGWYTGTYDPTGCDGAAPTGPISGAEVKRQLGLQGPGAALAVDTSAFVGQTFVYLVNSDQTFSILDTSGSMVNSGVWSPTPHPITPGSPSVLSPNMAK